MDGYDDRLFLGRDRRQVPGRLWQQGWEAPRHDRHNHHKDDEQNQKNVNERSDVDFG